jgi:hypothetical protein
LNSPVIIIDSEGAIETSVKAVYKAMKDKEKTPINFRFMCASNWMHEQFLSYLLDYLRLKKAKRATHVTIDIFIEQHDTEEED